MNSRYLHRIILPLFAGLLLFGSVVILATKIYRYDNEPITVKYRLVLPAQVYFHIDNKYCTGTLSVVKDKHGVTTYGFTYDPRTSKCKDHP